MYEQGAGHAPVVELWWGVTSFGPLHSSFLQPHCACCSADSPALCAQPVLCRPHALPCLGVSADTPGVFMPPSTVVAGDTCQQVASSVGGASAAYHIRLTHALFIKHNADSPLVDTVNG